MNAESINMEDEPMKKELFVKGFGLAELNTVSTDTRYTDYEVSDMGNIDFDDFEIDDGHGDAGTTGARRITYSLWIDGDCVGYAGRSRP